MIMKDGKIYKNFSMPGPRSHCRKHWRSDCSPASGILFLIWPWRARARVRGMRLEQGIRAVDAGLSLFLVVASCRPGVLAPESKGPVETRGCGSITRTSVDRGVCTFSLELMNRIVKQARRNSGRPSRLLPSGRVLPRPGWRSSRDRSSLDRSDRRAARAEIGKPGRV